MKKILGIITAATLFCFASVQAESGFGITLSMLDIDSAVKDDIDSNGTTDTTKTFNDTLPAASIFVEKTFDSGMMGMLLTLGVDVMPMTADIDKRSITQSSQKAAADGAATSGTNSAEGTISEHVTVYVQPGFAISDNMTLYGIYGFISADVEGKSNSISSTNITEGRDLDGTKVGIGLKYSTGDMYYKLDYAESDYDSVSWTTSNNTKGTADLDSSSLNLSIAKAF